MGIRERVGVGMVTSQRLAGLLHLRLMTNWEAVSHPLNTGKGGWGPRIPTAMGHFPLVYDENERLLLRCNQGLSRVNGGETD